MAEPIQCGNCGAVLLDADLFCGECGAPRPLLPQAPESAAAPSWWLPVRASGGSA